MITITFNKAIHQGWSQSKSERGCKRDYEFGITSFLIFNSVVNASVGVLHQDRELANNTANICGK